jgi:glucosamine--fructose-6-phosphate aminotransferase (isomerizing)
MPPLPSTPLLAAESPLDAHARGLVAELYAKEQAKALALPTDDPLDPKRRRRVEFTRTEMWQQPYCIAATLALEGAAIGEVAAAMARRPIDRVVMVGCGDSLASMIGVRRLFESLTGLPCEPVQALDFAYYGAETVGPGTLVVALSSSGVTVRTVEAFLLAKALGAVTLALTNTRGSALMNEADGCILIHAERKGWPTQASTAAMAALARFAIDWAKLRPSPRTHRIDAAERALAAVPGLIGDVLAANEATVRALAEANAARTVFLSAGGGPSLAAAMFGAAKIKECTPDHAIAIPLEEFHHYNSQKAGDPLWLVAPAGPTVPRAVDTAAEGRRWGGKVYSVVTEGETALDRDSDAVLRLPAIEEALSALVYTVPLQMFAYEVAMAKFAAAERAGSEPA